MSRVKKATFPVLLTFSVESSSFEHHGFAISWLSASCHVRFCSRRRSGVQRVWPGDSDAARLPEPHCAVGDAGARPQRLHVSGAQPQIRFLVLKCRRKLKPSQTTRMSASAMFVCACACETHTHAQRK